MKKFLGWAILVFLFAGLNMGMFFLYGGADDPKKASLFILGFYGLLTAVLALIFLIDFAIKLISKS